MDRLHYFSSVTDLIQNSIPDQITRRIPLRRSMIKISNHVVFLWIGKCRIHALQAVDLLLSFFFLSSINPATIHGK